MALSTDRAFASPYITLSNSNLSADNSFSSAEWLGIAVDVTSAKIWFYNPTTGKWNGGAKSTQNPGAGVGGVSYSVTGAVFPGVALLHSGGGHSSATLNVGGSAFAHTAIPSGYSAWDSSATWDSGNKGANITLTNGNLTATEGSTGWQSVRATTSRASGKYYFEIKVESIDGNGIIVGICNSSQSTSNYLGSTSTNGCGWQNQGSTYGITASPGTYQSAYSAGWRLVMGDTGHSSGKYYFEAVINLFDTGVPQNIQFGVGDSDQVVTGDYAGHFTTSWAVQPNDAVGGTYRIYYNGSSTATDTAFTTGNIVGIAIDIDNKKAWIYQPVTGKWNGGAIGTQNPATNTGGTDITTLVAGGALYPLVALNSSGGTDKATVTLSSPFSNTVPAGFSAWNPSAVVFRRTLSHLGTRSGSRQIHRI